LVSLASSRCAQVFAPPVAPLVEHPLHGARKAFGCGAGFCGWSV
jgi:hypothetical protein